MSFYNMNTYNYSSEQVDAEDQVSDDEFDYVQPTLQEFVDEYENKKFSNSSLINFFCPKRYFSHKINQSWPLLTDKI
ncbi:hypothetical protein BpHYR1_054673 [Brachionus plicatilis]|uniref:Uncharacterized protein n=1 Tax=Brachionus plicatilis TaxID=10195 RepID=A0A3M7PF30_BRAPC|nr:hypothetical protein BpHYR1_054673 [Brachionus plicatilis]